MSEGQLDIYKLDAGYVAFPSFEVWKNRTTVDTVRWDRYVSSLKQRADALPKGALDRARNIAKRAAALDTGAIEGLYEVDRGFTYTVAFETAAWEAALAQKGDNVRPLFEAQLNAYGYVLDLATKAEPISEAAIRALHEVVCAAQATYRVITPIGPQEQPLPKGRYKVLPNHVHTRKGTDHSYAPVDVTPAEMARLTAELRSPSFLAAHPVVQAAYAHYSFVVIHPFADGNGRVARALASTFTYRAISMPIVVLSEHRDAYITSLENADDGDYQAFVDFMLARSLDTISLVDESLRSAEVASADQSIAAIRSLYTTRGGYKHEEVDEFGAKLMKALEESVRKSLSRIQVPEVQASASAVGINYATPAGYRLPVSGGGRALNITLKALPPVACQVTRLYGILLPKDAAGEDDIQIGRIIGPQLADMFAARIDQLTPALAGVLQIRLDVFAERVVDEMFTELRKAAETRMGKKGT